MTHGLKVLLCLAIMALGFVCFTLAATQKEFILSLVALTVIIICVKVFLTLDQKEKKHIHEVLSANQTMDAVIEEHAKGGDDDSKGRLFMLLLSFHIDGKKIEKSYVTRWSSGIEELNKFISNHPKGSSISVLYSPKNLKVLVLETSREVLTEGSSLINNRLLKQRTANS